MTTKLKRGKGVILRIDIPPTQNEGKYRHGNTQPFQRDTDSDKSDEKNEQNIRNYGNRKQGDCIGLFTPY